MNTPVYSFSGDMARLQQATAESHDNTVRRSKVLSVLNLRTGEQVLEVGCGGGFYTNQLARFVGSDGAGLRDRHQRRPDRSGAAAMRRVCLGRMPRRGYSVTALPRQ